MNSIGQNLGSFLGFIGFLALNNPETCNTYLRDSPSGRFSLFFCDFQKENAEIAPLFVHFDQK